MLAFASIFAAVLTVEALSAARDRRKTAERVLQDYAMLGAQSAGQRLKAALNGQFGLVLMSAATLTQWNKSVPTVAAMRNNIKGNAHDVLDDSSRIIEVIVSPTGETKLETKGFSGSSCRDASRALEQALGLQSREQLTAEFYQSASQVQPQQTQS